MHVPPGELGPGTPGDPPAGWFRFHFADQRWEWSPEVEAIHGYRPGSAHPSTERVLAHKHPEDRPHIAAMIQEVRHQHRAFSTRHRIIDTAGAVHDVIVVADTFTDDTGAPVGTHGFYIDVTPASHVNPGGHEDHERVGAAIAEIAENRAVIEQAKGMLMVVYGISAEAAFDLLRWRSQEGNVKLRLLAGQVVDDFGRLARNDTSPSRAAYDNLLLTADSRVSETT